MTWHYTPMRTKFERVLGSALATTIFPPLVLCLVADAYAQEILQWCGFFFQIAAVCLAWWQVNRLDVDVFKGPGFFRRMGWKRAKAIMVGLAEESGTSQGTAWLSVEHPETDDVEVRLKRLEAKVVQLERNDRVLHDEIRAETHERERAIGTMKKDLSKKVHSVEGRLRDAVLGNDLEWLYVALVFAFMGTVLSTFGDSFAVASSDHALTSHCQSGVIIGSTLAERCQ